MTEQEAFEEWWNNRLSSMEYRTGKGWANIFWQAACKWQRAMIYDFVGRDFAHLEPQDALLQHQASCLQEERAISDKLLEALKDCHTWEPMNSQCSRVASGAIAEVEAIRAKQAERKD